MKKIKYSLVLIGLFLLVGCTLGNTPTAKVEAYLTDYQMLNNKIDTSFTNLTSDTTLDDDIKTEYEDAIKRQYRNMSYEIKDEEIDGDRATVTVTIEVINYKNIINKYNRSDYKTSEYHSLITKDLKTAKEMTTYTIEVPLVKGTDDIWELETISNETSLKLLGIY